MTISYLFVFLRCLCIVSALQYLSVSRYYNYVCGAIQATYLLLYSIIFYMNMNEEFDDFLPSLVQY